MDCPPSPPAIDLVRLDPALHAAMPDRFASLLTAFRAGYARTFRGDEAEADAAWEARILGEPPPQPVLLPGPAPVDDEAVRGPLASFLDEFHAALSVQSGMTVDPATLARMKHGTATSRPLTVPLANAGAAVGQVEPP